MKIPLNNITPLILTYNEAPNIERTLNQLYWAKQIIIVDSYSTDETLAIIKKYPQIKIFQRHFDTHAQQWNYGLEQVNSEWVLSLDADYVLSQELIHEIKNLSLENGINGYFTPFKYCIFGKPLRGTLLPPRQVLFKKNTAIYIDDGHTQLLKNRGQVSALNSYIYHDDRKPLHRWLQAQDRYMVIEAKKLAVTPNSELSFGDRIRKTKIFAPGIILLYCLIINRCILDGWAGWYYTLQRVLAEIWLSIRLVEYEIMNKKFKGNLTQ
ncbi:MAG: glycosyltransferase family 2 protein [Snowella sp.]|nr:glycosyltransferase family 2 protein [Snowella sp.]